jgi:hypothetical protein
VIYVMIVACEIAFWLVMLAGLVSRYLLGRPRLGAALLAATPLVDLVLLAAAVLDIRHGAEADRRHALAAIYLGVSIAFGHRLVAWADGAFAYRFAGGPKPPAGPRYGAAHARSERSGWFRHLLAWVIAAAVLGFIHLVGGNREETQRLFGVLGGWLIVVGIDFLWSFSYTFFPRRSPAGVPPTADGVASAAGPPADQPATGVVGPGRRASFAPPRIAPRTARRDRPDRCSHDDEERERVSNDDQRVA